MTNGNKNAKQLHPGIICDLCDGPICGRRYKCLICPDYDLCEKCEGTGYHGEHAMIRLATPQTEVYTYNIW
jgi:sequestosome 1